MKTTDTNHIFKDQQIKIDSFKKKHPKFQQIFDEYLFFQTELWNLETCDKTDQISDDFLDAMHIQISALEDEISDWLEYHVSTDS
ncbi:hypothetical protein [Elizabethkingia sp. JS20170427COW]|uniref:hypothetical protein n=1 Tax=Elizabethkingia sp. JS20170427COW TaxID=2583851 RepID=UPI001110A591|nr:hypothetical protein [Elizabethkingia sp. JS20170427COW]QCX52792.1 hypothetical protein FGE20_03060 [Elizabethkingia sp. JS20170427COW]